MRARLVGVLLILWLRARFAGGDAPPKWGQRDTAGMKAGSIVAAIGFVLVAVVVIASR